MKIKHFLPQLHIEIERWKYLSSMDVYISSYGRFKDSKGNLLSVGAKNNYLIFRGKAVHRLVLSTFKPVPNWDNLTVDHLNHNTRDNRVSNLEWVTAEENRRREKADTENNLNVIRKEVAVNFIETLKCSAYAVKLNGVKLPIETAQEIVCNDASLKSSTTKVKDKFSKIKSGQTTANEVRIGNFKLEILRNNG